MATKRTNSWFVLEVRKQVGNEYSFLEPYNGTDTKIKCCHEKCGYCWSITPYHFLRDHNRCPKCKNKLKDEEFRNKLKDGVGDCYIPLETYKGMNRKMSFFHKDCGKVVYTTPNRLLHYHKYCNHCAKLLRSIAKVKKSYGKFLRWLKDNNNPDFSLSKTRYQGVHTKYTYHHKCGWEGTTTPKELMSHGWRCYKCKGKAISLAKSWDFSQYKNAIYNKTSSFKIFGPYKGLHSRIKVLHLKCNRFSYPNAGDFLYTLSCSKCRESKNEIMVEEALSQLQISYVAQKTFYKCRYKKPLPFDFYLPDYRTCIEYDGQQHYYPVNFGGYDDKGKLINSFYEAKWRDHLKTVYCIKSHIKLIRIPYNINTVDKIKNIVKKGVL